MILDECVQKPQDNAAYAKLVMVYKSLLYRLYLELR